jgi:transcriptional regulator with PAS, ATPase and Fis domain
MSKNGAKMRNRKRDLLTTLEGVLGGYNVTPLLIASLRFFLRNPYESLVIVNKAKEIEFMDRGTEKFFNLPEGGAKGLKVTDLIPESDLPRVLQTGVPCIGRVFQINGHRRIGSTYPVIKNGMVVGAIGRLISRSFEEVERISREVERLNKRVKSLRSIHRSQHQVAYTFQNILGVSSAIKRVIDLAMKVSTTDADVLIMGESGTGKELFAQAIHNLTHSQRPFVRVNASAIPFELVESELFGYEKGTFTGANLIGKPGKFEMAHNGTFFLDEISSLPLFTQAKLLRVLQEREVERLGGTRIQRINFRLIAATNMDLRKLVEEGKFREDFYFRIAKTPISIPPLRERKEDIPIYIDHYLRAINERFSTQFKRLSNEAHYCFMNYDWPGNVRELINVLEQACLKKWVGEEITMSSLPPELINPVPLNLAHSRRIASRSSRAFRQEIQNKERELILSSLEKTNGNKRRAASLLGIPRSSFYKKLKDYGVAL